MKLLETNRLYLRNFAPGDVSGISDWRTHPDCSRYQRWTAVTPDAIAAFVERYGNDSLFSRQEEQHFAVCRQKTDALVGELAYFFNETDNCITLGITISYRCHRKGYAFEILTECLKQIRESFATMDIVALIDKENESSIRLFEKLGFALECYAPSVESYVYVLPGGEK